MIPTLILRIPLRTFYVYKQGWPDVWEMESLQNAVSNYNVAVRKKDTKEIKAMQRKIQNKLVKYFQKNQASASRYVKIQTTTDKDGEVLTTKAPVLVWRRGDFDHTLSDLEQKITSIRTGFIRNS